MGSLDLTTGFMELLIDFNLIAIIRSMYITELWRF